MDEKESPQTERCRGPSTNKTEQTRKKIIAAALDVFMDQGFSDARVADICKKAGVAKGSMYNYFQTKESLFESVLQEFIATARIELQSGHRQQNETIKQYLKRVLLPVMQTLESSGRAQIARLVIVESDRFPSLAEAYVREVHQPLIDALRPLLEIALQEGELRNDGIVRYPHLLLASNWIGMIHNGMLRASSPLNLGELFEIGLDTFFDDPKK